eukprot:scaffold2529_cov86-Skeletonema_dohrnii-CCMP3373.AAC.2
MTARSSASAPALVLPRCCKYIYVAAICTSHCCVLAAFRLVAIAPAGLALLVAHFWDLALACGMHLALRY